MQLRFVAVTNRSALSAKNRPALLARAPQGGGSKSRQWYTKSPVKLCEKNTKNKPKEPPPCETLMLFCACKYNIRTRSLQLSTHKEPDLFGFLVLFVLLYSTAGLKHSPCLERQASNRIRDGFVLV